ncbi:DUF6954 family protein [Bacillus salitolerans]|uniref:DUF6954 family protein n=1 Tax=Bacillus salitolerans TaxID=1437434 RepID=A0ABW4LK56_9BACI
MKWFLYILFVFLYILVTFFGLGPVLLADGSIHERMVTVVAIILLYIILSITLKKALQKVRK